MNTHFSGSELTTNELRAELIALSQEGDPTASGLLKAIASRDEKTAGELVSYYLQRSGSSGLETALVGLGFVCFGLVFGVLALAFGSFIVTDLETLLVLLLAFGTGQACLLAYHKLTTARSFALEFQKLASHIKINTLVKQHYSPRSATKTLPQNIRYAYGSVA